MQHSSVLGPFVSYEKIKCCKNGPRKIRESPYMAPQGFPKSGHSVLTTFHLEETQGSQPRGITGVGHKIHTSLSNVFNLNILVHIGTFWYILVHFGTFRYILVHFGTFWYILVHFGTFWYILVHFGTFWYILVHFGTTQHQIATD
jgi:hypothetical protein